MLGCGLMAYISLVTLDVSHALGSPLAPMADIQKALGAERTTLLIRHIQQEQARTILSFWERSEILIGCALVGCLFLATQRRIFPLMLSGLMVLLVLFQFRALSPEIAYQGREAAFPPGNSSVGVMTRLVALQQAYFGVEVVKLIAGGLLASYLFVFRASRRSRKDRELVSSPE